MERTRVEQLAADLESVNEQVVAACEACSHADWKAAVWDDGRPASAVFNHIADAFEAVVDWGVQIANGQTPPQFTMEQIHRFNDRAAETAGKLSKEETITKLQEKGTAAAAKIRMLDDQALDVVGSIPFMGGEINAERLIKLASVRHAQGHLKAILSDR